MTAAPLDCLEIAAAVGSHRATARQMADEALARAERLQDAYRAFVTLTPDLAQAHAQRVDRRIGRGERLPLAGVPFAVKDLFDVAGVPTTCGSPALRDRVPAADAEAVRRLVEAGGVLIGKLNMHECAFGFTGENPHFGDCRNPWDSQRIAGGSSSGSAVAVAAGICPLTLGSDTGGSIRHPAALCGLTGLKPTYGRVSRRGVVPLSWTLDHVGPMARTAAEAALALRVLAGHDPADETTWRGETPDFAAGLNRDLAGVRIGVPRAATPARRGSGRATAWFYESLSDEVAAAVEAALDKLAELGAELRDVALPHLDEVVGAHRAIIFSEAAAYQRTLLADRYDQFGADIRPLLLAGLFIPAADYLHAQRVRRIVRRAWRAVFDQVDCLATPTTPIVATRFGQQTADLPGGPKPLVRAYLDLTLPFNLSGHPALSMPCGSSGDGLPIGVQLVGPPLREGLVLRVAHQFQQATDWHARVPPVLPL